MPAKEYWQLYITAGDGRLQIPEIQMRVTPGGADQCSPGDAYANTETSGSEASKAFDDDAGTYWMPAFGSSYPYIIQCSFPSPVDIVEYTVQESSSGLYVPYDWELRAKDLADPEWTTYDTRSGVTWSGAGLEVKTFSVPVPPVIYTAPSFASAATFQAPSYFWSVPRVVRSFYRCILTGAPDVTLPISSFQYRLRDGDPSYLSVVVPNGAQWAAEIDARSNGQIVLYKGTEDDSGNQNLVEIARATLETVRPDEGARSYSTTLTGHRTTSATSPKTLTISNVSYRNVEGGKRRFRSQDIAEFLAPGDTAVIGAESIVVGEISTAVGDQYSQQEIVEA